MENPLTGCSRSRVPDSGSIVQNHIANEIAPDRLSRLFIYAPIPKGIFVSYNLKPSL